MGVEDLLFIYFKGSQIRSLIKQTVTQDFLFEVFFMEQPADWFRSEDDFSFFTYSMIFEYLCESVSWGPAQGFNTRYSWMMVQRFFSYHGTGKEIQSTSWGQAHSRHDKQCRNSLCAMTPSAEIHSMPYEWRRIDLLHAILVTVQRFTPCRMSDGAEIHSMPYEWRRIDLLHAILVTVQRFTPCRMSDGAEIHSMLYEWRRRGLLHAIWVTSQRFTPCHMSDGA